MLLEKGRPLNGAPFYYAEFCRNSCRATVRAGAREAKKNGDVAESGPPREQNPVRQNYFL